MVSVTFWDGAHFIAACTYQMLVGMTYVAPGRQVVRPPGAGTTRAVTATPSVVPSAPSAQMAPGPRGAEARHQALWFLLALLGPLMAVLMPLIGGPLSAVAAVQCWRIWGPAETTWYRLAVAGMALGVTGTLIVGFSLLNFLTAQ